MNNIDIDKYKTAWKNESSFSNKKLSEDNISKYLKKSSKGISATFRNGLIFDIILKSLSVFASLYLIYLFPNTKNLIIFNAILLIVIAFLLFFQIRVFRNLPQNNYSNTDLKKTLEVKLDFYYSIYLKSIYVSSFSASLIFLYGFLYYLVVDDGYIRKFQIDDIIVIGSGLIIAYAFNAFAQIKQHSFQIKQIEVCLKDFDDQTLSENKIRELKNKRKKMLFVVILSLLAGLLLFGYFMT